MSPPISSSSALAEALAGWPPPVLDPDGPFSNSATVLAWVLFGSMAAVFLLVCVALWVALAGPPGLRRRLGGERVVRWFGLFLPLAVLLALLLGSTVLLARLPAVEADAPRMRIAGAVYWWRVSYLDAAGRETVADANELHIPAGRTVLLELVSEDVIHSFWVPRLAGKMDLVPGRVNRLRLRADRPGVYGGQCAEFCGGAHALMGFVVVAHAPEDWQRWLQARQARQAQTVQAGAAPPAARPAEGETPVARGRRLFSEAGCATCHRIAGTEAQGLAGPDLTHVGSRRSLGAGILPNTRATLMGWIADSQSIKPNNRMPSYRSLAADEVAALASYMESLR